MKLSKLLVLAALCFSSNSQAALVLKTEGLACTQDYNEWGFGSQCPCPEASTYNQKIGKCLVGEAWPILVQGVLRSKKPSALALETQFGRYPLVVKLAELEKLKRGDGLYFEVSGEFIMLPGKGTASVPTIIVDSINWLD